jgi:hypothetical protein
MQFFIRPVPQDFCYEDHEDEVYESKNPETLSVSDYREQQKQFLKLQQR